jgi:hypothetical protein
MKPLFIYSLFTILLFSCQKNIPPIGNAKIVGEDFNKCVCCGGLEIVIDNLQSPNGQYFLVGKLPSDFVLGNNPDYPIVVTIQYTIDASRCAGIYVDITKIEKH